ncbi:MAG: hypothetical protein GX465_10625, partial [Acidobacteria bacterium]|nr:hypothetical protein [Acidobacteriota bacterium]
MELDGVVDDLADGGHEGFDVEDGDVRTGIKADLDAVVDRLGPAVAGQGLEDGIGGGVGRSGLGLGFGGGLGLDLSREVGQLGKGLGGGGIEPVGSGRSGLGLRGLGAEDELG